MLALLYLLICCIALALIILLYVKFGIYYAQGMSSYTTLNCVGAYSEDIASNIKDEFYELIDALKSCNIIDIILEFCDVIHNIIRYVIINGLHRRISCSTITWLLVFPFLLPCTIKLALRQKEHGCIRNHKRINSDHFCRYTNCATLRFAKAK